VLSHWTMHTYRGRTYNDESDEWYLLQLRTTMNINTPAWLDFVHIGLQFQIEHHMFPRLPRHNLRIARSMVKAVCLKHGFVYHETGFMEANIQLYRVLRETAFVSRSTKKGPSGFYESAMWEGMNLMG